MVNAPKPNATAPIPKKKTVFISPIKVKVLEYLNLVAENEAIKDPNKNPHYGLDYESIVNKATPINNADSIANNPFLFHLFAKGNEWGKKPLGDQPSKNNPKEKEAYFLFSLYKKIFFSGGTCNLTFSPQSLSYKKAIDYSVLGFSKSEKTGYAPDLLQLLPSNSEIKLSGGTYTGKFNIMANNVKVSPVSGQKPIFVGITENDVRNNPESMKVVDQLIKQRKTIMSKKNPSIDQINKNIDKANEKRKKINKEKGTKLGVIPYADKYKEFTIAEYLKNNPIINITGNSVTVEGIKFDTKNIPQLGIRAGGSLDKEGNIVGGKDIIIKNIDFNNVQRGVYAAYATNITLETLRFNEPIEDAIFLGTYTNEKYNFGGKINDVEVRMSSRRKENGQLVAHRDAIQLAPIDPDSGGRGQFLGASGGGVSIKQVKLYLGKGVQGIYHGDGIIGDDTIIDGIDFYYTDKAPDDGKFKHLISLAGAKKSVIVKNTRYHGYKDPKLLFLPPRVLNTDEIDIKTLTKLRPDPDNKISYFKFLKDGDSSTITYKGKTFRVNPATYKKNVDTSNKSSGTNKKVEVINTWKDFNGGNRKEDTPDKSSVAANEQANMRSPDRSILNAIDQANAELENNLGDKVKLDNKFSKEEQKLFNSLTLQRRELTGELLRKITVIGEAVENYITKHGRKNWKKSLETGLSSKESVAYFQLYLKLIRGGGTSYSDFKIDGKIQTVIQQYEKVLADGKAQPREVPYDELSQVSDFSSLGNGVLSPSDRRRFENWSHEKIEELFKREPHLRSIVIAITAHVMGELAKGRKLKDIIKSDIGKVFPTEAHVGVFQLWAKSKGYKVENFGDYSDAQKTLYEYIKAYSNNKINVDLNATEINFEEKIKAGAGSIPNKEKGYTWLWLKQNLSTEDFNNSPQTLEGLIETYQRIKRKRHLLTKLADAYVKYFTKLAKEEQWGKNTPGKTNHYHSYEQAMIDRVNILKSNSKISKNEISLLFSKILRDQTQYWSIPFGFDRSKSTVKESLEELKSIGYKYEGSAEEYEAYYSRGIDLIRMMDDNDSQSGMQSGEGVAETAIPELLNNVDLQSAPQLELGKIKTSLAEIAGGGFNTLLFHIEQGRAPLIEYLKTISEKYGIGLTLFKNSIASFLLGNIADDLLREHSIIMNKKAGIISSNKVYFKQHLLELKNAYRKSNITPAQTQELDMFIKIDNAGDEAINAWANLQFEVHKDISILEKYSLFTAKHLFDKYNSFDKGTLHYNLADIFGSGIGNFSDNTVNTSIQMGQELAYITAGMVIGGGIGGIITRFSTLGLEAAFGRQAIKGIAERGWKKGLTIGGVARGVTTAAAMGTGSEAVRAMFTPGENFRIDEAIFMSIIMGVVQGVIKLPINSNVLKATAVELSATGVDAFARITSNMIFETREYTQNDLLMAILLTTVIIGGTKASQSIKENIKVSGTGDDMKVSYDEKELSKKDAENESKLKDFMNQQSKTLGGERFRARQSETNTTNVDYFYGKFKNDMLKLGVNINPPTKILEIGVGSGSMIKHMKSEGIDIDGIDANPKMTIEEAQTLGVKTGSIENLSNIIGKEKYNIIFSHMVFDKNFLYRGGIQKQNEMMEQIYLSLKPDGIFYANEFSDGPRLATIWRRQGGEVIRGNEWLGYIFKKKATHGETTSYDKNKYPLIKQKLLSLPIKDIHAIGAMSGDDIVRGTVGNYNVFNGKTVVDFGAGASDFIGKISSKTKGKTEKLIAIDTSYTQNFEVHIGRTIKSIQDLIGQTQEKIDIIKDQGGVIPENIINDMNSFNYRLNQLQEWRPLNNVEYKSHFSGGEKADYIFVTNLFYNVPENQRLDFINNRLKPHLSSDGSIFISDYSNSANIEFLDDLASKSDQTGVHFRGSNGKGTSFYEIKKKGATSEAKQGSTKVRDKSRARERVQSRTKNITLIRENLTLDDVTRIERIRDILDSELPLKDKTGKDILDSDIDNLVTSLMSAHNIGNTGLLEGIKSKGKTINTISASELFTIWTSNNLRQGLQAKINAADSALDSINIDSSLKIKIREELMDRGLLARLTELSKYRISENFARGRERVAFKKNSNEQIQKNLSILNDSERLEQIGNFFNNKNSANGKLYPQNGVQRITIEEDGKKSFLQIHKFGSYEGVNEDKKKSAQNMLELKGMKKAEDRKIVAERMLDLGLLGDNLSGLTPTELKALIKKAEQKISGIQQQMNNFSNELENYPIAKVFSELASISTMRGGQVETRIIALQKKSPDDFNEEMKKITYKGASNDDIKIYKFTRLKAKFKQHIESLPPLLSQVDKNKGLYRKLQKPTSIEGAISEINQIISSNISFDPQRILLSANMDDLRIKKSVLWTSETGYGTGTKMELSDLSTRLVSLKRYIRSTEKKLQNEKKAEINSLSLESVYNRLANSSRSISSLEHLKMDNNINDKVNALVHNKKNTLVGSFEHRLLKDRMIFIIKEKRRHSYNDAQKYFLEKPLPKDKAGLVTELQAISNLHSRKLPENVTEGDISNLSPVNVFETNISTGEKVTIKPENVKKRIIQLADKLKAKIKDSPESISRTEQAQKDYNNYLPENKESLIYEINNLKVKVKENFSIEYFNTITLNKIEILFSKIEATKNKQVRWSNENKKYGKGQVIEPENLKNRFDLAKARLLTILRNEKKLESTVTEALNKIKELSTGMGHMRITKIISNNMTEEKLISSFEKVKAKKGIKRAIEPGMYGSPTRIVPVTTIEKELLEEKIKILSARYGKESGEKYRAQKLAERTERLRRSADNLEAKANNERLKAELLEQQEARAKQKQQEREARRKKMENERKARKDKNQQQVENKINDVMKYAYSNVTDPTYNNSKYMKINEIATEVKDIGRQSINSLENSTKGVEIMRGIASKAMKKRLEELAEIERRQLKTNIIFGQNNQNPKGFYESLKSLVLGGDNMKSNIITKLQSLRILEKEAIQHFGRNYGYGPIIYYPFTVDGIKLRAIGEFQGDELVFTDIANKDSLIKLKSADSQRIYNNKAVNIDDK